MIVRVAAFEVGGLGTGSIRKKGVLMGVLVGVSVKVRVFVVSGSEEAEGSPRGFGGVLEEDIGGRGRGLGQRWLLKRGNGSCCFI
jgi:hypothetical protein